MNVVMSTIHESDNNHSRNPLCKDDNIVEFVDLSRTHGVVVKKTHRPSERTLIGAELGVETLFTLCHELFGGVLRTAGFGVEWDRGGLKAGLVRIVGGEVVLVVGAGVAVFVVGSAGADGEFGIFVILDDGVVADVCHFGTFGGGTLPEKGTCGLKLAWMTNNTLQENLTHEDVIPSESVVLLDDLSVNKRHEEYGGKDAKTASNTKSECYNIAWGLLVETKFGRSLVHDGKCADGAGNEEEEWRSVDSPGDRIPAHVDNELNQQEDGGGEASGAEGRKSETGEDGLL